MPVEHAKQLLYILEHAGHDDSLGSIGTLLYDTRSISVEGATYYYP